MNHPSPRGRSAPPIDELMAGYAAGTLPPALQCLVAAHLAIKPDNRPFVSALESLCGAALAETPAGPVPDRDAKLAAIFGEAEPLPAREPVRCSIMPSPLAGLIGCGVDEIPWRRRLPGIREYELKTDGGCEAKIYRINPGRVMPSHTHDGSEVTLVLQGGFSDPTGHYRRGDIAVADAELDHHPRADENEDCICFAVIDAPLRLTGPVGRIVQRIFRH